MIKLIKRHKRDFIYIFIVVVSLGLFYISLRQTNQSNIFGDIYSHLKKGPNSSFASKLGGGVHYRNYRDPIYPEGVFDYGSKNDGFDDYLPKEMERLSLRVDTKSPSQALSISYDYKVTPDLTLTAIFIYDANNEQLSETVQVQNGNQDKLKEVLTSKNITKSDLQKETQSLLNKAVIHEWVEIHPSRYSEKNWGKIKIKSMTIKKY